MACTSKTAIPTFADPPRNWPLCNHQTGGDQDYLVSRALWRTLVKTAEDLIRQIMPRDGQLSTRVAMAALSSDVAADNVKIAGSATIHGIPSIPPVVMGATSSRVSGLRTGPS